MVSADAFARASALIDRKQYAQAGTLLEAPARAGDVSSQLMLGYCWCRRGDRANALLWYRRAARAGDASAANNIAMRGSVDLRARGSGARCGLVGRRRCTNSPFFHAGSGEWRCSGGCSVTAS